jgi:hypothetical protein
MRPFAAACQRQIGHFHSFLRVFWGFYGFSEVFYNFCGNLRGFDQAGSARAAHPPRDEQFQKSGFRGLSALTSSGRFNNATSGAAARK